MTFTPRQLFNDENVQNLDEATVLCKYMPYTPHFESLIQNASLYLRRLNEFEDKLEGKTSLAEGDATQGGQVKAWYEENRFSTFVTCFVIGESEEPHMWANYTGRRDEDGLMIMTTVERLKGELSHPSYTGGPVLVKTSEGEIAPYDGFTVGGVTYFSDETVDLYTEMGQPVSDMRHVFRKRANFAPEQEYRVVIRPGSRTSDVAFQAGDVFCLVPIRLSTLITGIRLKPGSSEAFRERVESLLQRHGLGHISVLVSTLVTL